MLKKRPFILSLDKQARMICNMDVCNKADDQYCIAHMLMTSWFDVGALITTHYGTAKDVCSEQCSYEEIRQVVGLMGLGREMMVLHGAPSRMKEFNVLTEDEGMHSIAEEAVREDSRPLFAHCIGAITNLAYAYPMNPEIAKKLTVIWIGGNAYPEGGFKYNLHNDVLTANVVFQSRLELQQVPEPVYIVMKVSFSELLNHVYPCSDIGRHLVKNMMRAVKREAEMMEDTSTSFGSRYLTMLRAAAATSFAGGLWSLGDSLVVGLILNHTVGHFHMIDAPCDIRDDYTYDFSRPGSRKIRVYDNIDNHFIIKDLFEKMGFYFGGSGRQQVAR